MNMVGVEIPREVEYGEEIEVGNAETSGDLRELSLRIRHVFAVAGEIVGAQLVAERKRDQEYAESVRAAERRHLAELRLDVAPGRFPPRRIEVGPVVERKPPGRVKLDQIIEHGELPA
jgi:hypothetical protein